VILPTFVNQLTLFCKCVDIDRVCTFSKFFWSYLRPEWVVRFEDETGDVIVEFNAPELSDALWEGM
jgi:hypothetical protein